MQDKISGGTECTMYRCIEGWVEYRGRAGGKAFSIDVPIVGGVTYAKWEYLSKLLCIDGYKIKWVVALLNEPK